MNCRKGDLALVISGPSTGTLITCLELLPAGWNRDDLPRGVTQQIDEAAGPLWRTDRSIDWGAPEQNLRHGISTAMHVVPDRALMPIRPEPDETPARKRIAAPAQC